MTQSPAVDCVYVAASWYDARFTRICIASVRYFYPEIPIRLLAGGRLPAGLVSELARYWDTSLAVVPRGDYGWGFVKLEPLFGPPGERFLMLDSDTVITGRVLDLPEDVRTAPFVVSTEEFTEEAIPGHFYDWRKMREVDAEARPPGYVFNSGHWIGTSGVLTRDDFSGLLEWDMPPRLRYPHAFYPGDQGVFNYVMNRKSLAGLRVERKLQVLWPGNGAAHLRVADMPTKTGPAEIIHWAGLKKLQIADMKAAEFLQFFEDYYYSKGPAGSARRAVALWQDTMSHQARHARDLMQRGIRKYLKRG